MNKKSIGKVISICTLLIIGVIVLFTYIQYNDYKMYEIRYSNLSESTKEELNIYIKSILTENKKKAESCAKIHSSSIRLQILNEYDNDSNSLEKDIIKPRPNSRLSEILDTNLDSVFVNVDKPSNKCFVTSMDKVIWSRNMGVSNSDIDKFTSNLYNQQLCDYAMCSIRNMNIQQNEFIFWEPVSRNVQHDKIAIMNFDNILAQFYENGLNSLKSYELLIPVYITENGDIFGTRDLNSIGKANKNFKLIVIQRLNMYDALCNHSDDIMYFENQMKKIENDICFSRKERFQSIEESIIIIIFILLISGYLQNRLHETK